MKKELKDIDCINDRINMSLLRNKMNRNNKEENMLKILIFKYPDHSLYENSIKSYLREIGMIDTTNSELCKDEFGRPFYKYKDLPKEDYTTDKGVKALESGIFPSELRQKSINKRLRYIQFAGIIIAAIGGLITLFNFFRELLK